jgi:uncharacterized protein (TIGR03790 family)
MIKENIRTAIVMTIIFLSLSAFKPAQASISPTNAAAPTPSQVLVVYNSNITTDSDTNICPSIQESQCLAQYYANARGIPAVNVVGIAATTTSGADVEEITKNDYINTIETPLETYLSTATSSDGTLLKNKIRDIVLMKGISLKINDGSGKSVDMSVVQLFTPYISAGFDSNPYFGADTQFTGAYRFIPNTFSQNGYSLNYLVTRLDGQSVADVKGMIDRSIAADTSGQKSFVIDDSQNNTYGRAADRALADSTLRSFGYKDVYDTTSAILTTASIIASSSSTTDPMIGYSSDGVHASNVPMSGNIYFNEIANNGLYANGAVANTFESYSGLSVATNNCGGQNCISNFIHAGGSGGFGEVYEPYSIAIPFENIWMPAYARGYTWAEAAYMGVPYINWQTIVLGDPLMTINSNPFYGIPLAPTNVSALAGNGNATVSFTPSTSNNPQVTGYVVTSSPGNIVATGTSSPIIVSGLTNGTPYTFSIAVLSAAGTSTLVISNAVTPHTITYPFTLTTSAGGTASAFPSGSSFASGTALTLSATPNSGYYFAGFTGSSTSSSTPFTFTLVSTTTEKGNFTHTAFPLAAISSINASSSDTSAVISWTTSEVTSSRVNYSTDTSYSSSTMATDTAPEVISHSVALSNLATCTPYHFQIQSTNMSNGISTSSDQVFTTTNCPISPVTSSGGAPSSGGGGGGGGVYIPYIPPVTPLTTPNASSSTILTPSSTSSVPAVKILVSASGVFLENFGIGTISRDVPELRQFLYSNGYVIGTSSGVFDASLQNAVIDFQNDHASAILTPSGLTAGTGFVGAATRAFINALLLHPTTVAALPQSSTKAVLTSYLQKGSRGSQVIVLQQFLSSILHISSEQIVSGYFGSITEGAVKQFQASKGIEQTGTVGPLTRAAINVLQ